MAGWAPTPGTISGLEPGPQTRRCGHRYHEGAPPAANPATCACGLFAIGLCAECGAPVCGEHSGTWEGRRLCYDDLQAAKSATAASAAARKADEAEAHRRAAVEGVARSLLLVPEFVGSARRLDFPGTEPVYEYKARLRFGRPCHHGWKIADIPNLDRDHYRSPTALWLFTDGLVGIPYRSDGRWTHSHQPIDFSPPRELTEAMLANSTIDFDYGKKVPYWEFFVKVLPEIAAKNGIPLSPA